MVRNLKGLPIVTDMESAIVRAIEDQTALKQIGCWRHLRQDVQRWLSDNLPRVERSAYVNNLYDILRAKTEEHCRELIEGMKDKWHEDYCKYFARTIEHRLYRLPYFCVWSIQNYCKVDMINGITTNMSEGFNYLIKDFQNWKEVPLDCLLMSLKLIKGFYLEEIRRGKAGLGTYSLKKHLSKFRTNVEEFESRKLICHPKDIVESIRNTEIKAMDTQTENQVRPENATNSRILRAKQFVAQDNISFSPKLGLFTIVDRNTSPTVRLFPAESCSCPIAKNCLHILAVKLGLRMQVEDCGNLQNVGAMRKNFRPVKQKPGRKRPRPGDIDTEDEPEQVERKRPGAEQTERGAEQMERGAEQTERGAEQTERGAEQTERGAEQTEQTERGAEQTERGAEQTERGAEQTERGAEQTEQTERGAEQTERGAEQTEQGAEQMERGAEQTERGAEQTE